MLIGALQAGAWLLLDSVDSITQGALSLLGQHLSDIHQCLSVLLGCSQRQRDEPQTMCEWTCPPSGSNEGSAKYVGPQISLAGKTISVKSGYGCVLISSGWYASDVPENLRAATRPVSLVQPDYRVIAEVTLASLSFSEAASMSCRLVSLFSLAEHSACLPESICAGPTSWVVLLNKVLTIAGMHLNHSLRVEWDKDKVAIGDEEAQRQLHNMVLRAPEGLDRGAKGPHLKSANQCAVVLRAIAEEQAVVKAVMSAVASAIVDPSKACHFRAIFGEIFPAARCPPCHLRGGEEEKWAALKAAMAEGLQEAGLHPSPCLLSSALSLYQAMRLSRAVVLVGLAGSGKTACYRALAGGLRKLAAREVEDGPSRVLCEMDEGTGAGAFSPAPTWSSVDTAVIFPNALSSEDLWGGHRGQQGSWWDGALTKVLRDSQELSTAESSTTITSTSDHPQRQGKRGGRTWKEKWLVLDGEPLGRPGWLDLLCTLCDPADPFLSLPTGEKLRPPPSELKVLIEATDLRDASPSMVTRCGLVHHSTEDLWKAVWTAELGALRTEPSLDLWPLSMWSRLAEDLFASTLTFLRQRALTPVLPERGAGAMEVTHGVQEVTSFIRILRALLEQFGRDRLNSPPQHKKEGTPETPQKLSLDPSTPSAQQELQARNVFVVAYLWGFGGHLHPRHWPQFDKFARNALFKSRYRVEVPADGSVFQYFPNTVGSLQMSHTIIPQYERYAFLLRVMLKARQPALLDLLEGIACQPARLDTTATVDKQPGLLLFVDDLHDAPCDVFGRASTALETLRQCMSKGGMLTSGGRRYKLFSSGALSFLATCDTPGEGRSSCAVVSPRLSHLFSVLVLPGLSADLVFSVHAPRLQLWLNELPSTLRHADMADCIIGATLSLYHAVREAFPPRLDRPHFLFSPHDLQKVFQGMCLWGSPGGGVSHSGSSSVSTVLGVARLWTHECLRTFGDRLCSEEEGGALLALLAQASERNFGSRLTSEPQQTEERGEDHGPTRATAAERPKEKECGLTDRGERRKGRRPEGNNESTKQGEVEDVDNTTLYEALSNPDTPSDTTRAPSALRPSPPKNGRPLGKPDRKRSGKLIVQLPQCTSVDPAAQAEQRPASATATLLQDLGAALRDRVFIPDLSTPLHPLARCRNAKRNSTYQERNLEGLVLQLVAMLMHKDEQEEEEEEGDEDELYSVTAGYEAHRQGARQLAHVLRALLLPGGHGCLLGAARGTGRKTTVRLAARLMGCRLLEVHSGNEAAVWETLKEASGRTGARGGVWCSWSMTAPARRSGRSCWSPWRTEASQGSTTIKGWKSVTQRISKPVKGPREHVEGGRGTEWYFRQIPGNTHVFLLLPLEAPVVVGGSLARALSLCSCVEVYQPWTAESLIQVATRCLKGLLQTPSPDTEVDRAGLVGSISHAMAGIHQSSWRYASVLTPDLQPFGPQTYAEFMAHYLYLCTHLCDQGRSQVKSVAALLGRMKELREKADQYSQEVLSLRAEFTEAQQYQLQLQCAVDSRRGVCERARQHCLLEETRLAHLEEQVQQARQQSQDALQQVSPLYEAALAAMHWESCQQLLGQTNFLQELEFYDRSAVRGELFRALSAAVREPGFRPEAVRDASRACESLCRWARAVHRYAVERRRMAPQEARRDELERRAAQSRAQLREARLQEEDARAWLEEAEGRLQGVRRATEELAAQLRGAQTRERDAASAVRQVAPLIADWTTAAQEAEMNVGTAPGDALLLAAATAYLGPFGPDVRSELLEKWRGLCLTGAIDIDPEDPRTSPLSPSPSSPPPTSPRVPIRLGEELPVARVTGTAQGGVQGVAPRLLLDLLLWRYGSLRAQRCPLLVDADQREGIRAALLSGQRPEGEGECDLLSGDDPNLLEKLREGAERGVRVLVTHVERVRPSPGFLELLGRRAGTRVPGLRTAPPAGQPGFVLFLSTPVPVRALLREIHPLILAEVQVVDLSLSTAELWDLMLAEMVRSKWPKLWSQNHQVKTDRRTLLDRLHQQEVSLMEYVLQSSSPLLQDPQFLPRAAACRSSVSGLRAELRDLDGELERHRPLLAHFHKGAELATAFYQGLQDVGRLCPLYLFPPRPYLLALRGALAQREAADATRGGEAEAAPGAVSVEVLASRLLEHYRPCLSRDHAAVLRLLVSVALAQHDDDGGSRAERAAFLRGLGDDDFLSPARAAPRPPAPPADLPGWIPAHARRAVLRLESLPSFGGLVSSLASDAEPWLEYLRFPSSTVVGPVPCPSHAHLSALQRALLWKTLLPHWLAAVADDLAACQLGKPLRTAGAPHPGSPEALSQILDETTGPVVLILPGPDEAGLPPVPPLGWVKQAAQCSAGNQGVKVQVISFGAECQREAVLAVLNLAVQEGHWLVFNNCHLLDQWDEEVVCQVTQLVSCTDRGHLTYAEKESELAAPHVCGAGRAHPRFRMWFITQAHAPLSVPAAVRSSALHLVCDAPWDLREALRCSLRRAVSSAAAPPASAGPLGRCAALHSVLLQRRACGRLGQGRPSCWSQEDLQVLLEAQVWTASRCDDPVGAMEYIAGSLVYGGHVEDAVDLEAVKGVATACLRSPPPLWGRGPHSLSELVAAGRFGQGDVLQDVDRCVQASCPSGDPLELGLSAGCRRSWLQALRHRLERDGGRRPAAQTPLRLFLWQEWDDLARSSRAELLGAYLWKGSPETPPYAYRLSAFHRPRGFLAALLREEAKAQQEDVTRLSLHFQVLSVGEVPSSLPSGGAYLHGLELQGALWDARLGALQDTPSARPCPLPLVWPSWTPCCAR
ncbi:hypothetical protein AAFF_G00079140 [Aldrovandia affinis]|uniref:Dynein heavy chain domain-containing protein 1 n=1 Tax=Aldrovandia affinis TaxID=143900 RepID=A0AAD7RXB7_9TELE|nr:hypothetical protein AAFF_G00079140 [Aldrovandia affinis]